MSIVDTIKSAVGFDSETPTYECVDCGSTFEVEVGPDSYWFQCPECGSEDPLGDEA